MSKLRKLNPKKPKSSKFNSLRPISKKRNKTFLKKRLMILLPLVCALIILNFVLETDDLGLGKDKTTDMVVKVLIYNGTEADDNCVLQVENVLNAANTKNLTPNVKFVYNVTDVINAETLSSYNVLVMPGGNAGSDYLDSESIDSDSIKNFVYSGKGYVGICAGAYAAANYTEDWYYGGGIAPDVNAAHPMNEENTTLEITSDGKEVFGYGGSTTMSHENGPALYDAGGDIKTFATYADNATGYEDYDAIVGDNYGAGRVVLSGVHPELAPQHPDILANLILWAADISDNSTSSS